MQDPIRNDPSGAPTPKPRTFNNPTPAAVFVLVEGAHIEVQKSDRTGDVSKDGQEPRNQALQEYTWERQVVVKEARGMPNGS